MSLKFINLSLGEDTQNPTANSAFVKSFVGGTEDRQTSKDVKG